MSALVLILIVGVIALILDGNYEHSETYFLDFLHPARVARRADPAADHDAAEAHRVEKVLEP
jgi:hypothetical protein